MARLPHADLVQCVAAAAPLPERRPWGGLQSKQPSNAKKRVPVRAMAQSTVRARQKDGLSRGDDRPPDACALSLEAPLGQGAEPPMRVRHDDIKECGDRHS